MFLLLLRDRKPTAADHPCCDKMSNHLREQNAVSVGIIFLPHRAAPDHARSVSNTGTLGFPDFSALQH
jgi:hypothetical protein